MGRGVVAVELDLDLVSQALISTGVLKTWEVDDRAAVAREIASVIEFWASINV